MRFVTATEFAISEIRRFIVEQTLPPGARIDQTDLANRLDVSRIPVRQALVHLAERGFVQLSAHRSARVAPISVEDVSRLYELRGRLEAWTLEEVVGVRSAEDLKYLDGLFASSQDARRAGDVSEYMEINREFHFSVFSIARNDHLVRTVKNLFDLSERYQWMYLSGGGMMETSEREHRDLLDALAAQDLACAQRVSAEHNRQTLHWVEQFGGDFDNDEGDTPLPAREEP